jgi:hypothetical protein
MNLEHMIKEELSELYIGNLTVFENNCLQEFLLLPSFPYKKSLKNNFHLIDTALNITTENVIKLLNDEYSFEVTPFIIEQYETWKYIKKILLKDPELTNDKMLLERIYIRIKLCKEGWSDESIEKFIITYFKDIIDYDKVDNNIIKWTYYRLKKLLIIKKSILGRPKIHPSVNSIIIKYKKSKNREKMREKYNIDKDLHKLFSKEEIDKIIDIIKTYKNEKENYFKQLKDINVLGSHFLSVNVFKNLDTTYEPILKKLEVLKKYT